MGLLIKITNKAIAIYLIGVNVFYFIPLTNDFISWKSGVTNGYIQLLLPVNLLINILTITGIVYLTSTVNTKQKSKESDSFKNRLENINLVGLFISLWWIIILIRNL